MGEPGTQRAQRRLADELEIMGFSVEVRPGSEEDSRTADERSEADAVVFVDATGSNLIWVADDGRTDPQTIDGRDDAPELLALRTAEHLRGELLPGEPEHESSDRGAHEAAPLISITAGPAVVYSRDAWAAVAWNADVAVWLGSVGVGPFVLVDLQPNQWVLEPKEFGVRQLSTGIQVRGALLDRNQFRVEPLGRIAWRRVTVHPTKGGKKDQFVASAGAILIGGGVQATYFPRPWVGVGGQLVGHIGIPITEPHVPDDLPKKKQEAVDRWVARKSVDGLFQTAIVVIFRF